ncbi:MAG: hypothetical protein ABJA16_04790 [Nakamurella sp.]
MSDTADAVAESSQAVDPGLVEVFRTFETGIWAHINAPDTPDARRTVAQAVATELTRVSGSVDTELQIVS